MKHNFKGKINYNRKCSLLSPSKYSLPWISYLSECHFSKSNVWLISFLGGGVITKQISWESLPSIPLLWWPSSVSLIVTDSCTNLRGLSWMCWKMWHIKWLYRDKLMKEGFDLFTSQIIGIKPWINKDYTIKFNIKFRNSKVRNSQRQKSKLT